MVDGFKIRNLQVPLVPGAVRCPGCEHPVVGVRPYACGDGYGFGIHTVRSDGSGCCSEWEGQLDTEAMAEAQCVITRAHIGLT